MSSSVLAPPTEVTFKATPFLAIVTCMNERLSPAACEKVLAELAGRFPEETRRVREQTLLASDRMSLRFATELMERAAAELHAAPAAFAHEIGRRGAELSTGTVLRFVFALVSMPSFLGKVQPVWQQLYSHGRMTVEAYDHRATVELTDFPFVSAVNCARVTGSLEWYAQKAESTSVLRHSSCRSRGDDACRWEVSW